MANVILYKLSKFLVNLYSVILSNILNHNPDFVDCTFLKLFF